MPGRIHDPSPRIIHPPRPGRIHPLDVPIHPPRRHTEPRESNNRGRDKKQDRRHRDPYGARDQYQRAEEDRAEDESRDGAAGEEEEDGGGDDEGRVGVEFLEEDGVGGGGGAWWRDAAEVGHYGGVRGSEGWSV
ncbi:hypothetical protein Droror1_Dr00023038 [Drosera rotundifolia]